LYNMDNGDHDASLLADDGELTGDGGESSEDKGLTFRKRRLSLTNLRQLAEEKEKQQQKEDQEKEQQENADDDPFAFQSPFMDAPEQQQPQPQPQMHEQEEETHATEANGDEKAHSFRKRRLSLTHKREEESSVDEVQEPPQQRRRRNSEVSQTSMESGQDRLKSRTVHAAELLAHPPPSPSVHQLYQQKSAPPQRPPADAGHPTDQQPKWKKRHTRDLHEDERTLPFPRDIVGTFSCHGVEPIYEDDYVLEDEEDSEWLLHTKNAHDDEKPTTAAKINQDRGGVAFPYGNCARTALFAVYDGKSILCRCGTVLVL
jgi:hypothetical protein